MLLQTPALSGALRPGDPVDGFRPERNSKVESQLQPCSSPLGLLLPKDLGRQMHFLCGCGWREGSSRIYVCTKRQL